MIKVKKYFYIFCITVLTFICAPLNVLGVEDYRVCEYQVTYHLTGGRMRTDTCYLKVDNGQMSVDCTGNSTFSADKYNAQVVNGGGINGGNLSGIDITEGNAADPKFLTKRCPNALCRDSNKKFYIDEDGCSFGTSTASLKRTVSKNEISSMSEAMLYQWGTANGSIVKYDSLLDGDGGCPTNVPVFKLFKPVYQLIKIATPVMLVLFATIDLAKAAAASDESMIKKAQKHCFKRVAAAVIVFLSFASVEMIIKLVSGGSDVMACVSEFLK